MSIFRTLLTNGNMLTVHSNDEWDFFQERGPIPKELQSQNHFLVVRLMFEKQKILRFHNVGTAFKRFFKNIFKCCISLTLGEDSLLCSLMKEKKINYLDICPFKLHHLES